MLYKLVFLGTLLVGLGCASLHHVQVGDVDDRTKKKRFFDLKVNEVGVDLREAGQIMDSLSRRREASKALRYVEMFQMGPRTGHPVYNELYADVVMTMIYRECPSGRVTGLMSIRENVKYPVISGEIVKVTGWCLEK